MRLSDLTWPDVDARLQTGTPIILPFGSIEQHGPHLPLETDTVCVQAVADRAAEHADAISLPALSYGAPSRPRSGGGPGFPLGAEIPLGTYYDTVRGIVKNLLTRNVSNLVLLTWHTENAAVMYEAAREAASMAHAEHAKIVVLDEPGNLFTEKTVKEAFVDGFVDPQFEHAGLIETAVMLALQPDAVRPYDNIETQLPKLPYDVVPLPEGAVSPTGSFTNPANATAEIGNLLLDELVPAVGGVITNEFAGRRAK